MRAIFLTRASSEQFELNARLSELNESGNPTPCQVYPDNYFSSSKRRKSVTLELCAHFLLLSLCREAGEAIPKNRRYRIRGGVDFMAEK